MRPLKPFMHSKSKATALLRSFIDDPDSSGPASLWSDDDIGAYYDEFINVVYTRNPHLKGLELDIPSEFNEPLIRYMTSLAFSAYRDDTSNDKRAKTELEKYEYSMSKISLR